MWNYTYETDVIFHVEYMSFLALERMHIYFKIKRTRQGAW